MYLQFACGSPEAYFETHNNSSHINRWDCCVMVLYHGIDSSSKHCIANLHNLSIRCKVLGLQKDSGDQYSAAGIDRTLNGVLTQCANFGNLFSQFLHYPVAHFFQWLKFPAEDWGQNGVSFKGKVNQNLFTVSGCDINKQATVWL